MFDETGYEVGLRPLLIMIAVGALCGVSAANFMPRSQREPASDLAVFIQKDACPFECCTFGHWDVVDNADVRARPRVSAPVVGRLEPGSTVQVATGEVHVVAGLARAIGPPHESAASLDATQAIEILDYIGEGYSRVRQGEVVVQVKIARTKDVCTRDPNERYCWADVLREPVAEWWVMLGAESPHPGLWVLMRDGALRAIDSCS